MRNGGRGYGLRFNREISETEHFGVKLFLLGGIKAYIPTP